VLVDQRGTGASAPMRCPELEDLSPLVRMYPPDAVARCREGLAPSHNLTQYTTLASARDLDAVRRALDADRIDISALSYGTVLAQAYMRQFPTRVRSAVLIGSTPMDVNIPLHHARNAQDALRLIFADCVFDPACDAAYPSLADEWTSLLARFNAGPIPVVTDDGVIHVERGPFAEAFRATLTTESGQRNAPRIIHAAAAGDFAPFLKAAGGPSLPYAEGLYLSIECAEGAARIEPSEVAAAVAGTFLGRYRVDEQMDACGLWPSADIPEEFFQPVTSDVPTLFIAGGRDHVTPAAYAEEIASHFSKGRVIRIEEMAHAPMGIEHIECLDAMMMSFYASADPNAVDASCVSGMTAPPFSIDE
jgi:pimeloyl-ACP methyl ester carboxylesterase